MFEATRELLFNVVKHAGTGRARVSTSTAADGYVHVVVTDDGAGFDPAKPTAGGQREAASACSASASGWKCWAGGWKSVPPPASAPA